MAYVNIHRQVPENTNSGDWTLCFQKVAYHYEDGSLQAARGQARIESYEQIMALINQAKEEAFFEETKSLRL